MIDVSIQTETIWYAVAIACALAILVVLRKPIINEVKRRSHTIAMNLKFYRRRYVVIALITCGLTAWSLAGGAFMPSGEAPWGLIGLIIGSLIFVVGLLIDW